MINSRRTSIRHTATAVAIFGLIAVGSACSNDDDALHSPADISKSLLGVDDLGTDWRETQRDTFDSRAVENPVLDPSFFCPEAADTVAALEGLAGQAGADVEMQQEDMRRSLRLQAWNNNDADEFFDTVADALATCDGKEWSDESVGVDSRLEVLDGPSLGDEDRHWLVVTSAPAKFPEKQMGAAGRISVARFGKVVMVLQFGDYDPDPEAALMDEDTWRDTVRRAGDKLAEL